VLEDRLSLELAEKGAMCCGGWGAAT